MDKKILKGCLPCAAFAIMTLGCFIFVIVFFSFLGVVIELRHLWNKLSKRSGASA